MIATRRRGYNKSEDVVEILHPDYQYFEITTTEVDQSVSLFYSSSDYDWILDGVPMGRTTIYNNRWGIDCCKIATPGFHQVYVYANGYNSRVLRQYGQGVLRPKRYTTNLQDTPSGIISKLILLQDTPPVRNNGASLADMCSNCDEILVPIEALSTYRNDPDWSKVASKIKGVKYKIIED